MADPNTGVISNFCKTLQTYTNLLGNYCTSLESNGLLGGHKWTDTESSGSENTPNQQAEELLNLAQSREYQVKFCHANVSRRRIALRSVSRSSFGTRTYSVSEGLDDRDGLLCWCRKAFLMWLSNYKRIVVPITVSVFLLLLIIVIAVVVTKP